MTDQPKPSPAPGCEHDWKEKMANNLINGLEKIKQKHCKPAPVEPSVEDCPNCPNQGWYCDGSSDEPEQVQCQFCYTNPRSRFNLFPPAQEQTTNTENENDLPF